MAILDALPGLAVNVTVGEGQDHETCKEYVDTSEEADPQGDYAALKYIESRPGAKFTLNISFDPRFLNHTNFCMGASVWIDGVRTNRRTFPLHIISMCTQLERIDSAEDTDEKGNRVKRQFGFARMEVGRY
jgi:hypothetical protein